MHILYEPNPSVAYWLTLVVTLVLPVAVAVVTKKATNSTLKALLLLALSAATTIISNLLAVDGVTDIGPMITETLSVFFVAVASYFGFWRTDPAGVTTKAQEAFVKAA